MPLQDMLARSFFKSVHHSSKALSSLVNFTFAVRLIVSPPTFPSARFIAITFKLQQLLGLVFAFPALVTLADGLNFWPVACITRTLAANSC